MVTPKDIHEKNFGEEKRGYIKDEVDDFLDEIIVDYDKVLRENKELLARIDALNAQVESYRGMENSLMHTMVTAHKAADDITEKAKRESEEMIESAQKEASNILNTADIRARAKMENYEKEMADVEGKILGIRNVLNEFKATVLDYSRELVEVVEDLSIPESVKRTIDELEPQTAEEPAMEEIPAFSGNAIPLED
jgi:cell division initiation protein